MTAERAHGPALPPRMGPLAGVRIVEIGALGPAPMCAMLLADLGATVLRIDRKGDADLGLKRPRHLDLLLRSRGALALDLKSPADRDLALRLIGQADALIEGFRPGVMERLGLGPETCLKLNPRLAYGRMTGWGQDGPLAQSAGHDVNYIALTGALAAIGPTGGAPAIPLNLVGDFGGGALYLAMGLLAAIIHARGTGQGQVVDAAMVDGAASLQTMFFGFMAAGMWKPERGANSVDSGSHFYQVYQCSDGKWVSVGAIEKRFYEELLRRLEIDPATVGPQMDSANWPKARAILAARFASRTRDEWCALLEGSDACFAPILSWDEAVDHPHMKARGTFIDVAGVRQPAPAPRFSHSQPGSPTAPAELGSASAAAALEGWLPAKDIEEFASANII